MYGLLGNKVSCVNNETAEIYKPRFSDAVTARMNTENKTVTFIRDYIFMYLTFNSYHHINFIYKNHCQLKSFKKIPLEYITPTQNFLQ